MISAPHPHPRHRNPVAVVLALGLAACARGEGTVDGAAIIAGTITDRETGAALAGAIVTTNPETSRAIAGPDGRYALSEGTRIGSGYRVTAEADGYAPRTSTITLSQGTSTLDFALELLTICTPGQVRCAPGGPPAVETCAGRGVAWVAEECPEGQVCTDASGGPACLATHPLVVRIEGPGGGVVASSPAGISCEPTCTRTFPAGTRLTLTASPFVLSALSAWSGDCSGSSATCEVVLDRPREVVASFETTGHLLTITRDGRGRVLSEPEGINCGTMCRAGWPTGTVLVLRAAPQAGAELSAWSGDGCSGRDPLCTITMDRDRTIRAEFTGETFDLVVTKEGTGEGLVSSDPPGVDCGADCEESFDPGIDVTLRAEPGAGSVFRGFGGDCSGTEPCVLAMDTDRAITAAFDPSYFAPLDADGSCDALFHFDAADPVANACGAGVPATIVGSYGPVASRSPALAEALSAGGGGEDAWIDTAARGPALPSATIELTIRKSGAAFAGRGRGVLYSSRDALDPAGAGLRLFVTDDGSLGADFSDGRGGLEGAASAPGVITDGVWTHVALQLGAGGARLYADRVEVAATVGPIPLAASSSTAFSGAEREGSGGARDRFNGALDELRVSSVERY